jgi:hypothetical protein
MRRWRQRGKLFFDEEIPCNEVHDDTDDYLDYLAYLLENAKKEGMEEQLPHMSPGLDK